MRDSNPILTGTLQVNTPFHFLDLQFRELLNTKYVFLLL